MTKKELENYIPKGQLEGFPKEIIARMLECQEEQGNKKDVSVFEKEKEANNQNKGFNWLKTQEGQVFWLKVVGYRIFDLFFEKYPKQDNQDNSQEFKVGDKVYDIIYGEIGVIKRINIDDTYSIHVSFNDNTYDEYLINGVCRQNHKIPQLLHYRDDYNYDVIDFNNLPKRQEPKRWRAEKEGVYNFVSFDNECWFFSDDTKDDYDHFDNDNYNSGNYFSTEVEAEIIAQKMNTYFKQLIQEEHEHKKRY